VKGNAEMVAFIDHELELLEKKKGSANSKKVEELKPEFDLILSVLAQCEKPVKVDELRALNSELGLMSNQKVSALLKKLKDAGRVVRVDDKKKAYFSIAE
jgi:hypothetical protein